MIPQHRPLSFCFRYRILLTIVCLVLGFCVTEPSRAATVVSQWTDANSNWNNAANWDPATVPNNGANQFAAVIFTGAGVTVGLDIPVTVNGLFVIGSNDQLAIGAGRSISVVGVGGGE